MGVPGFFMWLLKHYKKEGFVFQKEKLDNNELQMEINSIDYFLIDANCLIHPICFKTIADNPSVTDINKLENKMINNVLEYLDKLIDYSNPKKGIYLAIDGVAPLAKIKQQRYRRYKSIADKKLWDNIKKKHNKPISNFWNNSAITPGTIFMEKLHQKIITWCNTQTRTLEIIYSSCFTPAEGEHKLLQFIRTNQNNNKDLSYVIYGLDADLIFLALSTNSDKIYLLREANEINNKESREILNYVSIKIMKNSILHTIHEYLIKDTNESLITILDKNKIINDFIFMCYFLGNDFLPHIPSLDIHQNGLENIIIIYVSILKEILISNNNIEYLLNDNIALQGKTLSKINLNYFTKFINKLALQEEHTLKNNYLGNNKRKFYHGDDYEREIQKIENLQFKINDPIQLGSDNHSEWRLRYYKHYWGIKETDVEEFAENLVKHYLIGIKWVTQYYFDKCPSWDWYFPYDHPPFITDVAKYLPKININKIKFNKLGTPIKPFMQLLSVLPPQSAYLLPPIIANLTIDINSPIIFMYPYEFEQDFINKKKHWMAIPILPSIDIELIKLTFKEYEHKLSDLEKNRNEFQKIYKFKFI